MSNHNKYRVSLTAPQIAYLVSLAESDTKESTQTIRAAVLKNLKVFEFKMKLGAVTPAFASSEKQSMEERLGIGLSPAERRAAAYRKYQENPEFCTADEVSMAKTYMYENNMMTTAEEEAYENGEY